MKSMQLLKFQLKPGAAIAVNLVTFVKQRPDGTYPEISVMLFNTLSQVFKHVRCFIDNNPGHISANEAVNLVKNIASRGYAFILNC